jgi:hypothetical protein
MGTSITAEMQQLLNQKSLYSSVLYSSEFKHCHPSKYTPIQVGCSFGYVSKQLFDNYLTDTQRKTKMSVESDYVVKAIDQFEANLTDSDMKQLIQE